MFTWPQGITLKNLSRDACRTDRATQRAGSVSRSITKAVFRTGAKLLRSPKTVALAVSLVLSALFTAIALLLPDYHWLAWFSFLPLFVVVRSLRPLAATLAGGFWGGCLYLFCTAAPGTSVNSIAPDIGLGVPGVSTSGWLLGLLIVIPAVYVGLAARPTRAIGYKFLTLALGWTLIEVVLHLYNSTSPHQGLLTGSQTEGPQLYWLARLLSYVCTAFLLACANASLVGMLSRARFSFPPSILLPESPNAVGWHPSQVFLAIQSWTLRQADPRAPPISVAVRRLEFAGQ